jgi:hypothetical protein
MSNTFTTPITNKVSKMSFSYNKDKSDKGPFRKTTNSDVTNSKFVSDSSEYTYFLKNQGSLKK